MSTTVSSYVDFIGLSPNPVNARGSVLLSVRFKQVETGRYVVPASAWRGNGPWYADLAVPITERDSVAYVSEEATIEERQSEYNSILKVEDGGSGVVRVWALRSRPTTGIPISVINGMFSHIDEMTIPSSQWSGAGPWTCNVYLSHPVRSALCGMTSTSSAAEARIYISAGVHVSGVSDTKVVLRAMHEKPTSTMRLGILSE